MYTVIKRMEISASHRLELSYESKCETCMVTIGLLRFIASRQN